MLMPLTQVLPRAISLPLCPHRHRYTSVSSSPGGRGTELGGRLARMPGGRIRAKGSRRPIL